MTGINLRDRTNRPNLTNPTTLVKSTTEKNGNAVLPLRGKDFRNNRVALRFPRTVTTKSNVSAGQQSQQKVANINDYRRGATQQPISSSSQSSKISYWDTQSGKELITLGNTLKQYISEQSKMDLGDAINAISTGKTQDNSSLRNFALLSPTFMGSRELYDELSMVYDTVFAATKNAKEGKPQNYEQIGTTAVSVGLNFVPFGKIAGGIGKGVSKIGGLAIKALPESISATPFIKKIVTSGSGVKPITQGGKQPKIPNIGVAPKNTPLGKNTPNISNKGGTPKSKDPVLVGIRFDRNGDITTESIKAVDDVIKKGNSVMLEIADPVYLSKSTKEIELLEGILSSNKPASSYTQFKKLLNGNNQPPSSFVGIKFKNNGDPTKKSLKDLDKALKDGGGVIFESANPVYLSKSKQEMQLLEDILLLGGNTKPYSKFKKGLGSLDKGITIGGVKIKPTPEKIGTGNAKIGSKQKTGSTPKSNPANIGKGTSKNTSSKKSDDSKGFSQSGKNVFATKTGGKTPIGGTQKKQQSTKRGLPGSHSNNKLQDSIYASGNTITQFGKLIQSSKMSTIESNPIVPDLPPLPPEIVPDTIFDPLVVDTVPQPDTDSIPDTKPNPPEVVPDVSTTIIGGTPIYDLPEPITISDISIPEWASVFDVPPDTVPQTKPVARTITPTTPLHAPKKKERLDISLEEEKKKKKRDKSKRTRKTKSKQVINPLPWLSPITGKEVKTKPKSLVASSRPETKPKSPSSRSSTKTTLKKPTSSTRSQTKPKSPSSRSSTKTTPKKPTSSTRSQTKPKSLPSRNSTKTTSKKPTSSTRSQTKSVQSKSKPARTKATKRRK